MAPTPSQRTLPRAASAALLALALALPGAAAQEWSLHGGVVVLSPVTVGLRF